MREGRKVALLGAEAEVVGVEAAVGVPPAVPEGKVVVSGDAVPPSGDGVAEGEAAAEALGLGVTVPWGVPVLISRVALGVPVGAAGVPVPSAVPVSVGAAVEVGGEVLEAVRVAAEVRVPGAVAEGAKGVKVGARGVPLPLALCVPPAMEALSKAVGVARELGVGVSVDGGEGED